MDCSAPRETGFEDTSVIRGFLFLFQLSDVSSPRSITSTPLSGKESVFFAEAPFKVFPFCVQLSYRIYDTWWPCFNLYKTEQNRLHFWVTISWHFTTKSPLIIFSGMDNIKKKFRKNKSHLLIIFKQEINDAYVKSLIHRSKRVEWWFLELRRLKNLGRC